MAKKKNETTQIHIRVSTDELLQIQNNANSCEKTISGYIREIALNMCIIECDTSHVEQHTAEISSYRNAISQLIYTIKKTSNYTPADLEYIAKYTKEILKSETEFQKNYRRFVKSQKKLIANTVEQLVTTNIKI